MRVGPNVDIAEGAHRRPDYGSALSLTLPGGEEVETGGHFTGKTLNESRKKNKNERGGRKRRKIKKKITLKMLDAKCIMSAKNK